MPLLKVGRWVHYRADEINGCRISGPGITGLPQASFSQNEKAEGSPAADGEVRCGGRQGGQSGRGPF